MENQVFKPGDVVFHKANNLRMVVLEVDGEFISCKLVNALGHFIKDNFSSIEISLKSDIGFHIKTQMETK